jgi:DNA invertase Pin-like site-specific DNA recombinase
MIFSITRPLQGTKGRVFPIFGALAEFERDLIRERTKAGLRAAKERGRPVGGHQPWRRATSSLLSG